MLCCAGLPWSQWDEQDNGSNQEPEIAKEDPGGRAGSPGMKKPLSPPSPEKGIPPNHKPTTTSSSHHPPAGELISVTVPRGVYSGDIIHVSVPSDPKKLLEAVVPDGLGPGGVFMVQAPAEYDDDDDDHEFDDDNVVREEADGEEDDSDEYEAYDGFPTTDRVEQSRRNRDQTMVDTTNNVPFSKVLDVRDPPASSAAPTPRVSNTHLKKALLKVAVPLGTKEGSIIHVAVPGEKDRVIAAKVPPDCTEFHVEYVTEYQAESPMQNTAELSRGADAPEEKMLLVRVPRGAKAGQVIHVEIPDEPDRMIPATIPPGKVKEFHIKYQPNL